MATSLSIEEKMSMFKSRHRTSHLLKIDNFSLLKKYEIKEVESSVFSIGGHKLKLIVYPNGNENDNGQGHISIYVEFQDPGNVSFNFHLFVVCQREQIWRSEGTKNFNAAVKKKWGFPKIISLADLNTKGYLIGDCCLFGVELLGVQNAESETAESFSLIEKPPRNRVTWKMAKYSAFNPETDHMSHEFIIGNRKWRIQVFPRGDSNAKGNFLSVNLMAKGFTDYTPKTKTYAKYTTRVLNQKDGLHRTKTGSNWFSEEECSFGWSQFMTLRDLNWGYLVDNKLFVGVEIEVVSTAKFC